MRSLSSVDEAGAAMQLEAARTSIDLRPLLASDHAACVRLWAASDGVAVRTWEDAAALERLLARNPNLCWAAHHDSQLAATVLCGHRAVRPRWLARLAVPRGGRARVAAARDRHGARRARTDRTRARLDPPRPCAGPGGPSGCGAVLERRRLENTRGLDRGQRRDGSSARALGRDPPCAQSIRQDWR